MKFQRKRGVSVIVATLLLVAISVSAAVIVYVFVGGLAGNLTQSGGQPVTERLTIQSYTFAVNPGSCACSQEILEIFLLNAGPALTKVSTVYFDGVLLTSTTPPIVDTALVNNAVYLIPSTTTMTSANAGQFHFSSNSPFNSYAVTAVGQVVITFTSAVTYGSGHTVKVVSSTGAINVFTVVSGISG